MKVLAVVVVIFVIFFSIYLFKMRQENNAGQEHKEDYLPQQATIVEVTQNNGQGENKTDKSDQLVFSKKTEEDSVDRNRELITVGKKSLESQKDKVPDKILSDYIAKRYERLEILREAKRSFSSRIDDEFHSARAIPENSPLVVQLSGEFTGDIISLQGKKIYDIEVSSDIYMEEDISRFNVRLIKNKGRSRYDFKGSTGSKLRLQRGHNGKTVLVENKEYWYMQFLITLEMTELIGVYYTYDKGRQKYLPHGFISLSRNN